jgi:adenylyltransferase/sulfurtransferase
MHELIWRLPGAPLKDFLDNLAAYLPTQLITKTYIICRLGNDSQIAAKALRVHSRTLVSYENIVIKDVIGGLKAWAKDVDTEFPVY